jgi:hypothetical protein
MAEQIVDSARRIKRQATRAAENGSDEARTMMQKMDAKMVLLTRDNHGAKFVTPNEYTKYDINYRRPSIPQTA